MFNWAVRSSFSRVSHTSRQLLLILTTHLATCFVHIAALGMTLIMLFHVRSKYTAVGRKEIVLFFYLYMFVELLAIFLDSAIIPTAHEVYPVSRPTGSPIISLTFV